MKTSKSKSLQPNNNQISGHNKQSDCSRISDEKSIRPQEIANNFAQEFEGETIFVVGGEQNAL